MNQFLFSSVSNFPDRYPLKQKVLKLTLGLP